MPPGVEFWLVFIGPGSGDFELFFARGGGIRCPGGGQAWNWLIHKPKTSYYQNFFFKFRYFALGSLIFQIIVSLYVTSATQNTSTSFWQEFIICILMQIRCCLSFNILLLQKMMCRKIQIRFCVNRHNKLDNSLQLVGMAGNHNSYAYLNPKGTENVFYPCREVFVS